MFLGWAHRKRFDELLGWFFFLFLTSWKQVFAGPEWAALGFLVIEPSLRDVAVTKLKIGEHPLTTSLITLLEKTPSTSDSQARELCGVLAGRVSGVCWNKNRVITLLNLFVRVHSCAVG